MNVHLVNAAETTRAQFFHRTEKTHFSKLAPADAVYEFDAPADATLQQLLAIAYAARMPKGSARAGCFEVQTDAGVWSSPTGGRLNPRTATFKSWDELEAEE